MEKQYRYLMNGEVFGSDSEMPKGTDFDSLIPYNWRSPLVKLECSEVELDKIRWHTIYDRVNNTNPIDITSITTVKDNVVFFKGECMCLKCSPITFENMRFNVCSICGNKRCPHALNHNYKCTNSNDLGQVCEDIKIDELHNHKDWDLAFHFYRLGRFEEKEGMFQTHFKQYLTIKSE